MAMQVSNVPILFTYTAGCTPTRDHAETWCANTTCWRQTSQPAANYFKPLKAQILHVVLTSRWDTESERGGRIADERKAMKTKDLIESRLGGEEDRRRTRRGPEAGQAGDQKRLVTRT
eukprot:6178361-Pleurochrysis_carterae.AAC.1